jgi:GxxExxY protein
MISHRATESSEQTIEALNSITERVIACAIEVHKHLGPGLLEALYESALCVEFELAGLRYHKQAPLDITYKGRAIGELRLDLVVEELVIVEIKSVERMDPVFSAQALSYLRASGKKIGLLINFNSRLLKDGIKRFIL